MALPTLSLQSTSAKVVRKSLKDEQSPVWLTELVAAAEAMLSEVPSWPAKGTYHKIVQTRSRPKAKASKSTSTSTKTANKRMSVPIMSTTTLKRGSRLPEIDETGPTPTNGHAEETKKEKFGWHSRESVHPYDWSLGQVYEGWWAALGELHTEREKEYVHDLKAIRKLETHDLGEGIKAEAWQNSYSLSFPTSNRDFVQLVITIDLSIQSSARQASLGVPGSTSARSSAPGSPSNPAHELDGSFPFAHHSVEASAASGALLLPEGSDTGPAGQLHGKAAQNGAKKNYAGQSEPPPLPKGPMRSFLTISVPIEHEDAPGREKEGFVRAKYVSVERLEEQDPGQVDESHSEEDAAKAQIAAANPERKRRVKWTVATSSDPAGLVPAFLVDASMPKTIAQDVPFVQKWLLDWRQGRVGEIGEGSVQTKH